MGTEDVKVTAMNMYEYKEGLRFCKRWPCSTHISTRWSWVQFPPWSEFFSVLVWAPFPLVGLTLTWFIWGRNLALHFSPLTNNSVEIKVLHGQSFQKRNPSLYLYNCFVRLFEVTECNCRRQIQIRDHDGSRLLYGKKFSS